MPEISDSVKLSLEKIVSEINDDISNIFGGDYAIEIDYDVVNQFSRNKENNISNEK